MKPNEKETKIHKIKQDFDNNHTFKPQIDENSIKLMKKKKHNSRKSIMDPTLTHLNRLNETKFKSVVRKMSLDADVVKILSSTFLDSKKEYYEGKDRMKRGKSVCFIQTLNKSEKKIKEMEDVLDKELSFKKNSQNKVEYDRSLRFLVKIAAKKEH